MFTFTEIEDLVFSFEPCPFCGGKPEWVVVPGEDYVMRCSQCHAATKKARMKPEEEARDWNRGEIVDDHFSITSDKRIDEYLHEIKEVRLSGYLPNEFPPVKGGFLCSEAVIESDGIILFIDPVEDWLHYDEINWYSPTAYNMSIADAHKKIEFISSSWDGKYLTALRFQCGDTMVTLSADEEEQCMVALFEENVQ